MRKPITEVSRLLETRRARFSRWVGAALIVCSLHVGGAALALINWHEEETADDVAGALTVELAALPAPARVDSPDVAHGPESQDAMPAPQVSKQVAEEVVKDLPLVEPSPAPEPEVVLPKPKPVEKEEPREEEVQEAVPEEQKPNEAAELRIAAAPLRVEAQEVPSSVPSPRQSASLARAQATWQKRLTHQLNRHKRTLPAALSRYRGRVVVVAFTLDRSGKVIASHIAESSGLPALDGEALALLQRASPFPAPPDQLPGLTFYFTQPITLVR